MRNIALTGPHGTGKSSILSEVARQYPDRIVEFSFLTVGKEPEKDSNGTPEPDMKAGASKNPAAATRGAGSPRAPGPGRSPRPRPRPVRPGRAPVCGADLQQGLVFCWALLRPCREAAGGRNA